MRAAPSGKRMLWSPDKQSPASGEQASHCDDPGRFALRSAHLFAEQHT
jgi:hypothetical protein